jgi:hypothetical protein
MSAWDGHIRKSPFTLSEGLIVCAAMLAATIVGVIAGL